MNEHLGGRHTERLFESHGILGPESLAEKDGWVYTGVMDGRIMRFRVGDEEATLEEVTRFNASCATSKVGNTYFDYERKWKFKCCIGTLSN